MILGKQLEMRLVSYYGLLLKSRDETAERFILHFLFQKNTIASYRSNLLKNRKCYNIVIKNYCKSWKHIATEKLSKDIDFWT